MAMQTILLKENEGQSANSIGQLSSVPWWSAFGAHSQPLFGESCGQLKPFSLDQPGLGFGLGFGLGDGLGFRLGPKETARGTDLGLDRGNSKHFTIFAGDCKFSGDGQKSLHSSPPEYHAFELGFGPPLAVTKYPYIDQYCGIFSYGNQFSGRVMLPLNLTADEGPIYVNAKQYHGIIRRRQSRAKAAVLLSKIPKQRKPYRHESRHLHAMRRPRGCGGRFLNTKSLRNEKPDCPDQARSKPGGRSRPSLSPSSEVLQSESGTLNSSKDGPHNNSISGSEVTSVFSLDHFHALTGMIDVRPTAWISAADHGCINLKA